MSSRSSSMWRAPESAFWGCHSELCQQHGDPGESIPGDHSALLGSSGWLFSLICGKTFYQCFTCMMPVNHPAEIMFAHTPRLCLCSWRFHYVEGPRFNTQDTFKPHKIKYGILDTHRDIWRGKSARGKIIKVRKYKLEQLIY